MTQQVVAYGSATTTNYGYDATNQLTSESIVGGATTNYFYDANGNRTTGYTTGQANRLTTDADGYTYTYDAEGNVTVRQKSGDYQEFEWNYHNLLTRATFRNAPGGTILKQETYRYDVFDRRIGQTTTVYGAQTTVTERQFIWDEEHVLFVYTKVTVDGVPGPVQLTNRYLHGPAIDQVFADEQLAGTPGRLWALTDHLGSVRDVVDTGLTRTIHRVYDGFGRQTSETVTGGATFVFGFTGREFDAAVGLQYNRARYYDPRIGRWISEDPIGFDAGDPNLYRYVFNSPTSYTDPSGQILPIIIVGAAVGFGWAMWPTPAQAPGPGDRVHPGPNFDLGGGLVGASGGAAAGFLWCVVKVLFNRFFGGKPVPGGGGGGGGGGGPPQPPTQPAPAPQPLPVQPAPVKPADPKDIWKEWLDNWHCWWF